MYVLYILYNSLQYIFYRYDEISHSDHYVFEFYVDYTVKCTKYDFIILFQRGICHYDYY